MFQLEDRQAERANSLSLCLFVGWLPVNCLRGQATGQIATGLVKSSRVVTRVVTESESVSLVLMFHEVFILPWMCHDFVVSETCTCYFCLESSSFSSLLGKFRAFFQCRSDFLSKTCTHFPHIGCSSFVTTWHFVTTSILTPNTP